MLTHWKTSLAGVCTIIGALVNAYMQYYHGQTVNTAEVITAISVGIGLIKAADATTSK